MIRPVHIDGGLYVSIAVTMAMVATFGSDEAAKYVAPATLWYLKNIVGWGSAGLLALKLYRSQVYSSDVKEQQTGMTEAGDPVVVKK